jgi:GNAT superfamily N-acetyltransferase
MTERYTLISPANRQDYRELISGVADAVWPAFMLQDPVAALYWDDLFERFPSHQFAMLEGSSKEVVGIANSVPLAWDLALGDLPDGGWDWALAKSVEDHASGLVPNLMCAIQIAIAPSFQRKGLSNLFLDRMRELARSKGFDTLVAPVRPSSKHRYPLSAISSYITWTRPDGLPYDPWLRVHVRKGGRIIKPCPDAMRIAGTVAKWEEWTGLRFFESGQYPVAGALVPITIDLEEGTGVYVEPNVWVAHDLMRD